MAGAILFPVLTLSILSLFLINLTPIYPPINPPTIDFPVYINVFNFSISFIFLIIISKFSIITNN